MLSPHGFLFTFSFFSFLSIWRFLNAFSTARSRTLWALFSSFSWILGMLSVISVRSKGCFSALFVVDLVSLSSVFLLIVICKCISVLFFWCFGCFPFLSLCRMLWVLFSPFRLMLYALLRPSMRLALLFGSFSLDSLRVVCSHWPHYLSVSKATPCP